MPKPPAKLRLAIDGGKPIRAKVLPYGRQIIDAKDIAAVTKVLRSDWLTTGPRVKEFEDKFAKATGAAHGVAFSSGTASLHAAMHALDLKPGDEVIVPALTFAASSNAALYLGARPVFADVNPDTLLVDPTDVAKKFGPRTKAVVAVDFGGQPCDYDALRKAAPGTPLVADACHSLGGKYGKRKVGTLADLSCFSFHPVKHITTGEGGMVTTERSDLATRLRRFRGHGITTDFAERIERGLFTYDMADLGFNYRLTDLQCALGTSQLAKLPRFLLRRRKLAALYDRAFAKFSPLKLVKTDPMAEHAYHLYLVRLNPALWQAPRDQVIKALRSEGIGANLHYQPVYWHSYYRKLGYAEGLCPVTEREFKQLITLPLHPTMDAKDVSDVVAALKKIHLAYGK